MGINSRLLFTFLFLFHLASCSVIKPSVYTYRSMSKMSKDNIYSNYNLSIDNTVEKSIKILFEREIELSQKPDKKQLLLKILLYDIDDINLNPYVYNRNIHMKIIGIDSETKNVVFETFAKSVVDGVQFKTHRYFNAFTSRSNLYVDKIVGRQRLVNGGRDSISIMQEQILFLIKQSLKLIGSNIDVYNVESDFDLEKFIKKTEK